MQKNTIMGIEMVERIMLCTVALAAKSGEQLYFSDNITFMDPQGNAHISTITEAVVGSISTTRQRRNMAKRQLQGITRSRIRETR